VAPTSAATPCDVGVGGGFTGLQNQLYRVEIHQGNFVNGVTQTNTVTYKWSRDNGSVAAALSPTSNAPSVANPFLVLQSLPPDDAHGFSVGQWVEILDDKIELQGRSGVFVKLTAVDGVNLSFNAATASYPNGGQVLSSPPSQLPIIDMTAHPK